MHPDPHAVALAPDRDRVVEVLRRLGVDRERRAARGGRFGPRGSAPAASCGSKPSRRPSSTSSASRTFSIRLAGPMHPLDARAAAALGDDDEVAGRRRRSPLRSIVIGVPGTKYGSPTTSLPRLLELDDREVVRQTRRKRRIVMRRAGGAEQRARARAGSAPCTRTRSRSRPCPRRACPMIAGRTSSLPRKSSTTAAARPEQPRSSPSTMNGPRTNQFEAPTSFITSISRRRAKIESRIVFADQDRRRDRAGSRSRARTATSNMCATRRIRVAPSSCRS